jgi:hypothetical protein
LGEDHFVSLEVLDVSEVDGPEEGEAGNEEHAISLRDECEVHCLRGGHFRTFDSLILKTHPASAAENVSSQCILKKKMAMARGV